MERKNAWKTYSEEDISKLNAISAEYVKFLDNGKTERECVAQTVEMAKAKGYRDLNTVIANGEKLNPGDCVHIPANAPHSWKNPTAHTAKLFGAYCV